MLEDPGENEKTRNTFTFKETGFKMFTSEKKKKKLLVKFHSIA
jgi:hypothetical protein